MQLPDMAVDGVTVRYATKSGSAQAGEDYNATSGTLTFAPGQIHHTITVYVGGEKYKGKAYEASEDFFVLLSSPLNATLGVSKGRGVIVQP